MPITIPIPDARWRAAVRDRARRGRPLPFRVEPQHVARSLWRYRPFRWALIAGLVSALASTAHPGWLPTTVEVVGNVWASAVMYWLGLRTVEHGMRRLYIVRRARAVAS